MFYNSSDSGEDDNVSIDSDKMQLSDERCYLLTKTAKKLQDSEECILLMSSTSHGIGKSEADETLNSNSTLQEITTIEKNISNVDKSLKSKVDVGHIEFNQLPNTAHKQNALQHTKAKEAKQMLQIKIDYNSQHVEKHKKNQNVKQLPKDFEDSMAGKDLYIDAMRKQNTERKEGQLLPNASVAMTKVIFKKDRLEHDSFESFHSAQELLDESHPMTEDTFSINSDKSVADYGNEELHKKIKCDEPEPSRLTTDRSLSEETLHVELSKLRELIDCIAKEREIGNYSQSRKLLLDCALSFEDSCNAHSSETYLDENIDDCLRIQRGYWSSIFGQASQCENKVEFTLEERYADIQKAHRALELLEDYHSRLSEPQDRALRIAIERVIRIFKSRLFQALLARDFFQAYKNQAHCVQAVVKMLQQVKEENWCLPIMYTVCSDLRMLAQKCEALGNSSKSGEILEKAADCLMSCFRVCAADNRSSDDDTKRIGMLNLVNQLFKVYFRINKLHLCKPLIRAIDSSAFKESFPLAEQITYKFFVGRKAMYDADYKTADDFLSFALRNCPRNFPRNKRLILIYLVPVKMLLGYMPKKKILERFDVLQFYELSQALKEGNVRRFDEVIQTHKVFFIKFGIYLLVEKLKFIVYRNLFKKVYLIKQTHQLDLAAFQGALQFVGEDDMTMDETHCIVANLIFEGKIKGYISHSHNKLVVSKQNPFPPVNTVA